MTQFMRIWALIALFVPSMLFAQEEPIEEEPPMEEEGGEEQIDYSQFVQTEENKAFCSSRIVGQRPIKLFSIGYDFQGAHSLTSNLQYPTTSPSEHLEDAEKDMADIRSAKGMRFAVNYPVISKNSFVLNLGLNYAETRYDFKDEITEGNAPLIRSLNENGLKSTGFTATVFKPFNSKRYMIVQAGLNLNGDFTASNMQSLDYLRYTGAVIYGVKANDRKIWGFGASRTYLGGALNYVPVYYMLYTAQNKKWGLEMLLPARFQYRRNINQKNLLLLGWEVEGNTFRINNDDGRYNLPYNDMELRRSELRFRATWEHALTSQIWLSAQAGYRYNWSFDIDRGDFFRPFGDDEPFLVENTLTDPIYFNISINWVSP